MLKEYISALFLSALLPSVDALRLQVPGDERPSIGHRIAWFHAPKTATSIATTFMKHANSSLPAANIGKLLEYWDPFWEKYPQEEWFKEGIWKHPCDHDRVTEEAYREFEGDFVGIFRKPLGRLISAYYNKGRGKGDPLEYASRFEGTMTLQLAGQEVGEKWIYWPKERFCSKSPDSTGKNPGGGANFDDVKPTPDIDLALERLRKGFKFVGLSEEYDLSVCLFHAMYGGECLKEEFENMRPGVQGGSARQDYVKSILRDYSDTVDGQLYDAAKEIFWNNVKKYNVGRSTCQQLCPQAGDIFGDVKALMTTGDSNVEYDWPGRYHLYDPDLESVFQ